MSFTLPRYNPRLRTAAVVFDPGEEEDPYVWFADFGHTSRFSVGWPISTGVLRWGLGPMGTPTLRRL